MLSVTDAGTVARLCLSSRRDATKKSSEAFLGCIVGTISNQCKRLFLHMDWACPEQARGIPIPCFLMRAALQSNYRIFAAGQHTPSLSPGSPESQPEIFQQNDSAVPTVKGACDWEPQCGLGDFGSLGENLFGSQMLTETGCFGFRWGAGLRCH